MCVIHWDQIYPVMWSWNSVCVSDKHLP